MTSFTIAKVEFLPASSQKNIEHYGFAGMRFVQISHLLSRPLDVTSAEPSDAPKDHYEPQMMTLLISFLSGRRLYSVLLR